MQPATAKTIVRMFSVLLWADAVFYAFAFVMLLISIVKESFSTLKLFSIVFLVVAVLVAFIARRLWQIDEVIRKASVVLLWMLTFAWVVMYVILASIDTTASAIVNGPLVVFSTVVAIMFIITLLAHLPLAILATYFFLFNETVKETFLPPPLATQPE